MKFFSLLVGFMLSIMVLTSCGKENIENVENPKETFVMEVGSASSGKRSTLFNEDESPMLMEISIVDDTNTPLANITCTLTSTNGGVTYSDTSSQAGVCTFPSVDPGEYTVSLESNGQTISIFDLTQTGSNATIVTDY